MFRNLPRALAAMLILGTILVACGGDDSDSDVPVTQPTAVSTPTEPAGGEAAPSDVATATSAPVSSATASEGRTATSVAQPTPTQELTATLEPTPEPTEEPTAAAAEPRVPLGEPYVLPNGGTITIHEIRDGVEIEQFGIVRPFALVDIEIDASSATPSGVIYFFVPDLILLQTESGGLLTYAGMGGGLMMMDSQSFQDLPSPLVGRDIGDALGTRIQLEAPLRAWVLFHSLPGDAIVAVLSDGLLGNQGQTIVIAGARPTEEDLIKDGYLSGPVEADGLRFYVTDTQVIQIEPGRLTINNIEVERVYATYIVAVGVDESRVQLCATKFAGSNGTSETFNLAGTGLSPNLSDVCAWLGHGDTVSAWIGVASPGNQGGEPSALEISSSASGEAVRIHLIDFE